MSISPAQPICHATMLYKLCEYTYGLECHLISLVDLAENGQPENTAPQYYRIEQNLENIFRRKTCELHNHFWPSETSMSTGSDSFHRCKFEPTAAWHIGQGSSWWNGREKWTKWQPVQRFCTVPRWVRFPAPVHVHTRYRTIPYITTPSSKMIFHRMYVICIQLVKSIYLFVHGMQVCAPPKRYQLLSPATKYQHNSRLSKHRRTRIGARISVK